MDVPPYLISASADGQIVLWHPASGQLKARTKIISKASSTLLNGKGGGKAAQQLRQGPTSRSSPARSKMSFWTGDRGEEEEAEREEDRGEGGKARGLKNMIKGYARELEQEAMREAELAALCERASQAAVTVLLFVKEPKCRRVLLAGTDVGAVHFVDVTTGAQIDAPLVRESYKAMKMGAWGFAGEDYVEEKTAGKEASRGAAIAAAREKEDQKRRGDDSDDAADENDDVDEMLFDEPSAVKKKKKEIVYMAPCSAVQGEPVTAMACNDEFTRLMIGDAAGGLCVWDVSEIDPRQPQSTHRARIIRRLSTEATSATSVETGRSSGEPTPPVPAVDTRYEAVLSLCICRHPRPCFIAALRGRVSIWSLEGRALASLGQSLPWPKILHAALPRPDPVSNGPSATPADRTNESTSIGNSNNATTRKVPRQATMRRRSSFKILSGEQPEEIPDKLGITTTVAMGSTRSRTAKNKGGNGLSDKDIEDLSWLVGRFGSQILKWRRKASQRLLEKTRLKDGTCSRSRTIHS